MLQKGTLRLFKLFDINVYVHWSWLVMAVLMAWLARAGTPLTLHIAIYLSLFAMVLLHEFGHALACKSVGGRAERIVLWPLGGIAFVQPPPRPGAVLWSLAAGPLVNVLLLPLTFAPVFYLAAHGQLELGPALIFHNFATEYFFYLAVMNMGLLAFNLLPIYPLDGGQILQALLWFIVGRAWSLIITTSLGLLGAVLFLALGLLGGIWYIILAFFMGTQSWAGLQQGRILLRVEKSPRYPNVLCPNCHEPAPVGSFWLCPCGNPMDTFVTAGHCLHCGRIHSHATCPFCGRMNPHYLWYPPIPAPLAPEPPAAEFLSPGSHNLTPDSPPGQSIGG